MNGDEIKMIRKNLVMTQADLAKALGVSFSTISRWENENEKEHPSDSQVDQLEALKELSEKAVNKNALRSALKNAGLGAVIGGMAGLGLPVVGGIFGSVIGATVGSLLKTAFYLTPSKDSEEKD